MLRLRSRVQDNIRNILRLKRINTGIHLSSALLITMETNLAKRRFHNTRLNRRHLNIRRNRINTNTIAKRLNSRLRSAIHSTLRIRINTSRRTKINNMTRVLLQHIRQHRARYIQKTLHIRINHRLHIINGTFLETIQALRQTSVIYQNIDAANLFHHLRHNLRNRLAIRYIQYKNSYLNLVHTLQGRLHFIKLIRAACAQQQIIAMLRERNRRFATNTRRCARNKHILAHRNPSKLKPHRPTAGAI